MKDLENVPNTNAQPSSEQILELRKLIGQLPNLEIPSKMQVETMVATMFPNLPEHAQGKLVEIFLKSEADAAAEADKLAA